MSSAAVLILAVSVSIDAFAVSVGGALCDRTGRCRRNAVNAAAFFGTFQIVMPLIGYFAATLLAGVVAAVDHWLAFLLLGVVGGKMIYEGIRPESEEERRKEGGECSCPPDFFAPKALFIPAVTAEEAPTEYTSGDYRYTLQPDGTAAIVKYTGSASELSIPDTLDGHAVTAIGDKAFASCRFLMSVTIPDGVTAIGDSAFRWCDSLTSVTIPDGVTSIGEEAFSSCESLTRISIPESVTSISKYAFAECSELLTLTVVRNSWAARW